MLDPRYAPQTAAAQAPRTAPPAWPGLIQHPPVGSTLARAVGVQANDQLLGETEKAAGPKN